MIKKNIILGLLLGLTINITHANLKIGDKFIVQQLKESNSSTICADLSTAYANFMRADESKVTAFRTECEKTQSDNTNFLTRTFSIASDSAKDEEDAAVINKLKENGINSEFMNKILAYSKQNKDGYWYDVWTDPAVPTIKS